MTKINFNPAIVEPEQRFEALPAGSYECKIIAEAVKPTKDGSGAYLELHLEIIEGAHAGRKIFDRVNLKNSNQKAIEIGLARLSAICRALGIEQLEDTNQLVDRVLSVSIGLERDKETKALTGRNLVNGYSKLLTLHE